VIYSRPLVNFTERRHYLELAARFGMLPKLRVGRAAPLASVEVLAHNLIIYRIVWVWPRPLVSFLAASERPANTLQIGTRQG
jgi:hypothetical protein